MGKLVISNRYATSYFKVGIELDKIDKFHQDVNLVLTTMKSDGDLYKVLSHPRITVEEKKAVINALFSDKLDKETINFLYIIIDKNRATELRSIILEFNRIYDDYKNTLNVIAITAVALDDSSKENLIKELEESTKRSIKLTNEVDPKILGGVIIKTETNILDGSLLKQLEDMKIDLKEKTI